MKRFLVLALTLLVCAIASPAAKAADVGKVTCTTGADCDAKWRRALRWVMDNSVFPITEQSDTVISTDTRLPFGDTDLIFTITKAPQGYGRDNVFQFDFKAGCGTFFSGCRPTIQDAEAAFARYVSGGAAIPGAIVEQPAPGAVAGGAAPTAQPVTGDAGVKLVCKGGGAMNIHFDYQKNTGTGRPDQVLFELNFEHAPTQTPGPGQCALSNRVLRPNEPSKITMSGSADKIGFEMTLTADKKLNTIAVKGTGGLHDGVANFLDAAISGKDFTADVTNISNQQWEVTGQYAY
jgi:hypothetical protein